MQPDTAIMIGVLSAGALYLILQMRFVRVLFGFCLLTQAANLLLVSMSGLPDGKAAPLVSMSEGPMVDPLPQALTLTAIVIGFGTTAFLVFLFYRLYVGHRLTEIDRLEEEAPRTSLPEETNNPAPEGHLKGDKAS